MSSESKPIFKLLEITIKNGASDLFLVANSFPKIRVDGVLNNISSSVLTAQTVEKLIFDLLTPDEIKNITEKNSEIDKSFKIENLGRFRVNIYKAIGTVSAVFRVIPLRIKSLDELQAPEIFKNLAKKEKGLILVTGSTGSGKSTTIAGIIDEINKNFSKHIITIEDPVEFIHENKKSLFSYREVGKDTVDFKSGLKYLLRQAPDVILIGEIRDSETMRTALTASETGHLVLATLHTNSAVSTLNRILNLFDGNEQNSVKSQLSNSLISIISQTLVPKIKGGRKAIYEILLNNSAVSNLIREDKISQIYSTMQLASNTGMITQSSSLKTAIKNSEISKEEAFLIANQPEEIN
jgi:twitching motility protein PilT